MHDDSTADREAPGRLIVVATPIGNLDDLSPRAREALAGADLVACEDTRHTGLLLSRLGIKRPLVSLHEHNERQRVPELLERLAAGETIALASDAGTPLVADPGFVLVREAARRGHAVEPVPGPSALLAALVASGLPPLPFTFAGFPPAKGGKRRTFYQRWSAFDHTVIFYESPHRIVKSLADLGAVAGIGRPCAVGRELTKRHEEILRGTVGSVHDVLATRGAVKGELVVVLGAGEPAAR
jgi:16S rRNA (cytidine1402-2'-O)-methyltransferase